jgi:hypothetical protein
MSLPQLSDDFRIKLDSGTWGDNATITGVP